MLIALNKPYLVHCKFTDDQEPPRPTLAQFGLPPRVYAAGRLDHDSEGLLLLTDDGRLNRRLTRSAVESAEAVLRADQTPGDDALSMLRISSVLN